MGSEWISITLAERMLNGFNWLRLGTSGGLRWWTAGFWRHGVSYRSLYTILRTFYHLSKIMKIDSKCSWTNFERIPSCRDVSASCLCVSVWKCEQAVRHSTVSCCVFLVERGSYFFLVGSPSYFFNNEYRAAHWACECNPLLYDLNHKYSDVKSQ
jgi:hypothetical protein